MTTAEYRQAVRDAWTEQEFTDAVIALFQEHGWLVHHDRPARTEKGWRTAVQGDAGFPDIVAAKDGWVVFAELKSGGGRVTASQDAWLTAIGVTHNEKYEFTHEVAVWQPSDWLVIERIARGE